MTPDLIAALISLVAKVGFQAAISLMENLKSAKTIDDAIVALKTSSAKSWDDYKKEA